MLEVRLRFACALGLLVSLGSWVGCGSNSGATGPTLEELGPQMAKAVCKEVEGCVGTTFLGVSLGGVDCEKHLQAQLEDDSFAKLQAALDAHHAKYHGAYVDECLSGVAKLGCGITAQRLSQIAGCDKVFEGTIDVGADCDVNEACNGDAYCQRDDSCPGTCTQRAAKGASCTDNEACKSGLVCGNDGKCAQPTQQGDACGGGVAADCGLGLVCQGEDAKTAKAGKCVAIESVFAKKDKEVCDPTKAVLCEPELSCIASLSGVTLSWACATKVASGADCHFGAPTQCPDDEFCDADVAMAHVTGKCQTLPVAGEACRTPTDGSAQCAPGLACSSDGKCRDTGRVGDDCADKADCASNFCDKQNKCATDICEL